LLIDSTWITRGIEFTVKRIIEALEARLTFDDNLQQATIDMTTPAVAGTTFTVTHNLGRTPRRWIVNPETDDIFWSVDKNLWDQEKIYLRCSGSSVPLTITVL
jgi:hypothetical protein